MIGKLDPEVLTNLVVERTGEPDEAVVQGPAYGEDTAAIDLGDDYLVVNADPLSLAADRVGELGVHVVCNDVAASGAKPRWLTNTMFLPDADPDRTESIITQLDRTARECEVAIVGGHAEYLPTLERPLLSLTAMGRTDTYVPAGGATPGDTVLLVGTAGIEGTGILATDFAEELRERGVDRPTIEGAEAFIDRISVIEAALGLRTLASGMHDPTEGGVIAGLVEMARAAGLEFAVERDAIPIAPETSVLCNAMEVDPCRIFGSGALIVTIPEDVVSQASDAIQAPVTPIGTVQVGSTGLNLDGTAVVEPPRDDLYALWE